MNNPFTSGRTLFSNPPQKSQTRLNTMDQQSKTFTNSNAGITNNNNSNSNNTPNSYNYSGNMGSQGNRNYVNSSIGGGSQQFAGSNAGSIGSTANFNSVAFGNNRNNNVNFNSQSSNNVNNSIGSLQNQQNPKQDLNFRAQFRNTSPVKPNINTNNININSSNSSTNIQLKNQEPPRKTYYDNSVTSSMTSGYGGNSSSNNVSLNSHNNTQTRVVSDKQYPPYTPNSIQSSIPTVTIPNSSSIASLNPNTNSVGNNSFGVAGNVGASKGSNFSGNAVGVERQKMTFGVASMQDNVGAGTSNVKVQYDRAKFVNREDMYNGATSAYSIGTMSNANSFNQRQSNAISSTKGIGSNTPIAPPPNPSYNHNTYTSNPGSNTKNMTNLSMSPIQQNSKHMMDQPSYQFLDLDALGDDIGRILASSKNQEELMKLLGIQGPGGAASGAGNTPGGGGGNNSFGGSGRNNVPEVAANTNTMRIEQLHNKVVGGGGGNGYQKFKHDYSYSSHSNKMNNIKQQNQQVFDYQSQLKPSPVPSPKTAAQDPTSNPNNRKQIKHTPPPTTKANTHPQIVSTNKNNFGQELQSAIDAQMRRLSTTGNGKIRVFLSATDKIETVKYNLQHI